MTPEDKVRQMLSKTMVTDAAVGEWDLFRRKAHRRLLMNRVAMGAAALLLVAGGVATGAIVFRTDAPPPTPALPPAATGEPAPSESTPSPSERTLIVEVWLTSGELLHREIHEVPEAEAVGAVALAELLELDRDSLEDTGTAIPPGVEILGTAVADGIFEVTLSEEFDSGGGSLSMRMRVAQVVYTLTQFPTVEAVSLRIGEDERDYAGGEGVDLRDPLTRDDFEDLAPAIVVESPRPGAEVSSPVTISGNANVFEANVNIRILDENGAVLNETFTTATCGTGCRGTYEKAVKFAVDHTQPGTIEVLTYSAEDGSPQSTVSTPVTLRA